ncbi:MAG: tetratricopeptide repeat protein, partial [Fibrobacterota bacterium]
MFPQTETHSSSDNQQSKPQSAQNATGMAHEEDSGEIDKVTGEDIEDKLDQLFPSSEQKMKSGSVSEDLEEMPELASEEPIVKTEEENVTGDDVQDRIRELFTSEESSDNKRVVNRQNLSEYDTSEEIDERDEPFSLPDHVLTPTLADIYFQQGQPKLALQIYERLAQRDPDDSSIVAKIEEIRDSLERSDAEPTEPVVKDTPKTPSTPKKKSSSGKRKRKTDKDSRPLAGVRIKKRPRRSK